MSHRYQPESVSYWIYVVGTDSSIGAAWAALKTMERMIKKARVVLLVFIIIGI